MIFLIVLTIWSLRDHRDTPDTNLKTQKYQKREKLNKWHNVGETQSETRQANCKETILIEVDKSPHMPLYNNNNNVCLLKSHNNGH